MSGAAADLDVELVPWPGDEARREALAIDGLAVLLLVRPDVPPPVVGPTEDWIRLPATERDVAIRVGALAARLRQPPRVADGVLVVGDRQVPLARREAALLGLLLAVPGAVVARADLEAALWPQGAPSRRALDDALFRLRHQRLGQLGLEVLASYGRGFSLQPLTAAGHAVADAEAV